MRWVNKVRTRFVHVVQTHRLLVVILLAFILLASLYSVATPIFEAGDEIWHYPFVQHLATGHSLPIQTPGAKTLWMQEGGQPPLYYALSALATFWIDTRDLSERLWYNPHTQNIGVPLAYGNKNLIIHTSAEDFPWHNTALAVHLIRLLSILLSTGTIALTYVLVLEIEPERKLLAAAAAAIVAFNPMFIFISASVNNDNLATLLATLALVLLVRLITRGPTLQRFAVLGVVLGLAALSKVSDAGLMGLAGLVFAYLWWRGQPQSPSRSLLVPKGSSEFLRVPPSSSEPSSPTTSISAYRRTILRGSLLCAALVMAIAGWWYARNWMLYGDPTGFNVWVAIAGSRPAPLTLLGLLGEFQGFRISFWGNFGGVNLIAPDWAYTILDALSVLALIGLVVGLLRRTLPRLLAIPVLWTIILLAGLVRWTLLTVASQGRLIFPAIGAIAVLMVYGLERAGSWKSNTRNWRGKDANPEFGFRRPLLFPAILATFLLAFAVAAPFAIIAPAYALPVRWPADTQVPNPVHITFGDQAELVGYALPQRAVKPGAELPLTVYWRTPSPIAEDLSVYIRLYDTTGKVVGRWDAYPGNGLYPTRFWQPGELIVDSYRIPLAPDAQGPGVGRIEVGLFHYAMPQENLVARDPSGKTITPTIARFKIVWPEPTPLQNIQPAIFGDQLALIGYQHADNAAPGSSLPVKIYWRALASMTQDYTVFVHLVDTSGKTVAQKDDQPGRGTFPTSFWDVGEAIADEYVLTIPADIAPGVYRIEAGVYRAADNKRLALRTGGDALSLGQVHIGP